MAKEFSDDLILEIVARLPLKSKVRCSVLNKNIRIRILEPNFLPHYSTVFYFSESDRRTFTSMSQDIIRSGTLDRHVSIVASCHGLLLLHFGYPSRCYIFNPTTSEITALPARSVAQYYKDIEGLAINENSFKLVSLMWTSLERAGTRLRFTVTVPSLAGSGELWSKSDVVFEFQQNFEVIKYRPIYAHGSLYWLTRDFRFMVEFDVEKEEARLIDGPAKGNELDLDLALTLTLAQAPQSRYWFGFANGEIHYAYASEAEIVICRHNHRSGEWRVKHRITNCYNDGNCCCSDPVFFDGRLLLFFVWSCKGGYVYRYNVEREVWEEKIKREFREYPVFFPYTSSFVKVSDTYLNEKNISLWEEKSIRNTLLKMQRLLRPAEN